MKTIVIAENPLEPSTWERTQVENVTDYLMTRFPVWPPTARIYDGAVALSKDVTPVDEASTDQLDNLSGPFYVITYPAGDVVGTIGRVMLAAATLGGSELLMMGASALIPKVPNVSIRNTQSESPNNSLSDRRNVQRIAGRIPDIYGTVRSTPDLLSYPYRVFVDHMEIEYAYMCIGRGSYDVSDVRDGSTPVSSIDKASVEIFGPNTSPNLGTPQLRIGDAIDRTLYSTKRYSGVNGQVLRSRNQRFVGASDVRFVWPNRIELRPDSSQSFLDVFEIYDQLIVENAPSVNGAPLDATYEIMSISKDLITVNVSWVIFDPTSYVSPTLRTDAERWVGPFIVDRVNNPRLLTNFVAPQGLFRDNGSQQLPFDVEVKIEATPIDANGAPTGPAATFTTTVNGSQAVKATRAETLEASLYSSRYSIRACRVTPTDYAYQGTIADEVRWRDLYTLEPVTASHFGNVTTVHSRTYATSGALDVKERKLNMLATRRVRRRGVAPLSGDGFSTAELPTNRADDIFVAICLDPRNGNRALSELNIPGIYAAVAEAEAYFGSSKAIEFNYTFDQSNVSFEEMVSTVASVVFCTVYRLGSIINLSFEKANADSAVLFNHRTKIPGSEMRTVRFGNLEDNDGVELEYVDPTDDAVVTFYVPEEQTAVNPRKIETLGIRSKLQARFHAYRAWNKIRYQSITTEFEATEIADLLVRGNRILVSDGTHSESQEGYVEAQDGLVLTLSQDVTFALGVTYTAFLQHTDGTVEPIPVTQGATARQVILGRTPRLPLALEKDLCSQATYMIVGNNDHREKAFLLTEKEPKAKGTSTVRAINYHDNYYQNDKDYVNGLVDINGNLV